MISSKPANGIGPGTRVSYTLLGIKSPAAVSLSFVALNFVLDYAPANGETFFTDQSCGRVNELRLPGPAKRAFRWTFWAAFRYFWQIGEALNAPRNTLVTDVALDAVVFG